jgi:hypothetical protein
LPRQRTTAPARQCARSARHQLTRRPPDPA